MSTLGYMTPRKHYLRHIKMSGGDEGGDGLGFRSRFKRIQSQDSAVSASSSRGSGATSASSQLMRSQLASTNHSLSSSNLTELKSSSTSTKSTSNLTEVKAATSTSATKATSNVNEIKSSTSKSSNLSELKSSISEAKSSINEMTAAHSNSVNFSRSMSKSSSTIQQSSSTSAATTCSSAGNFGKLKTAPFKKMGSLDPLNMGSTEQLALPDVTQDLACSLPDTLDGTSPLGGSSPLGSQELKFEEKKVTSSSSTKVVTDKNSFESASDHKSESRKVQAGDVSYEESSKIAASKSKLEVDGVTAEKAAALQEEARQLRAGDVSHKEGSQVKGASMKVSGDGYSAQQAAVSQQQHRETVTPSGTISQKSSRKASKSGVTINSNGICTQKSSVTKSSQNNISITGFEDLDLGDLSQPVDINRELLKFSSTMTNFVDQLKDLKPEDGLDAPSLLENINTMMQKAWSVPTYGHELGSSLCNVLRHNGGLDIILSNCNDDRLKYPSAKVLEQCLTTENRGYVVEKALDTVVSVACDCVRKREQARVGTGILEHLFKHSEGTCSNIIKLGGLEAVLLECRNNKDKDSLLHCAGALANLSLYGGSENHQAMMKQKVEHWLFPLAFHEDDNIKYYACLAIAALVANKEIEATVTKSGTLSLIEPFVLHHKPEIFADSTEAHRHGQSKSWLKRLVPVLSSKREEACNLAAFHFCMEVSIKKKQGNLDMFREIGAIEPLKKVASSPFLIASKYSAQALNLMGEEVPHKLTPQVPLWSAEDVKEWVRQNGFGTFAEAFQSSRVDGDLLLRITDENLKEDIGMTNGIFRKRFLRELKKLKQMTDYSSCDSSGLNAFLIQTDPEFAEYTYPMLQAGVTQDYLRCLTDEQLAQECDISSSIHRQKIRNATKMEEQSLEKDLDVFISYRRSNGSQLASLLKVHMSLRGISVFIDVERLEAGKFDNNLLNSIRQAKNFLLVLTANALDRCIGDDECKDWVHREIVAALEANCNIIPIMDNFHWPDPETLPEDMRPVCYFNAVRWIHEYQDACVDKLERFITGEAKDILKYACLSAGFATPGTPRAPPLYQRTASIESGKGSSCSDKDLSKD